MLSRLAESLYWIGRYVERAENTARMLNVNYYATLEAGGRVSEEWKPLLDISGTKHGFAEHRGRAEAHSVAAWLAFDRRNASSIASSLSRARENARGLRDRLPSEMWEHLNSAYLELCFQSEEVLERDGLYEYCSAARDASQMFFGIAFATLPRDEGLVILCGPGRPWSAATTCCACCKCATARAARSVQCRPPSITTAGWRC